MDLVRLARATTRSVCGIQRRTIFDARRVASANATANPPDRFASFTRDEQITSELVRIKNDDDGGIGQPQQLARVLRNIDRNTHTVVQLAKDDGNGSIVKIVTLMDLLKQVREKEERVRQVERAAKDRKPKQIELNWAISENDLDLKLKQLEAFVNKGKKVELLLAAKKRQRKATIEEGQSVLDKLRDKLQELGAKELKPMEGQLLKQATMVVKKE